MFRAARITLFLLLAAAVIATSFGVGYMVSPGGGFAPPLLASESRHAVPGGAPEQFKLLDEVWNVLQQDFVEPTALDRNKLGKGAIDGLIAALGDAHTSYIDAQNLKEEQESIRASYEGIGASVQLSEGAITIVTPRSRRRRSEPRSYSVCSRSQSLPSSRCAGSDTWTSRPACA